MKTLIHSLAASAAFLGLFAFAAPQAWSLVDDDKEAEESEEEEEEEEDQDEWFAVVGGDIHTGTGAVLRGGSLLAKNGVIEEVGYDLYIPDEAEVLDAGGMRVYPGLVAMGATSRISRGLFGAEQEVELDPHHGLDDLEPGQEYSDGHVEIGEEGWGEEHEHDGAAEGPTRSDAGDSYDPYSQFLVLALAAGITTAEQSSASMKLKRGEIDDVVMNEKYMTSITYSRRNPSSKRNAREKFEKASSYLREFRAWQARGDKEEKEPSKSGVDMNVVGVLSGTVRARFNANDRDDILGIARLAQRFHFRPVIYGCQEGWTVADELGRAGAYAVLTPRDRRPKNENLVRPGGTSIENAAKLHRAGVQVTVVPANTSFDTSGMSGRDLLHLPIEAGFAVRGGLSDEAALEAITINPARLMGVDHRVGSLEVGKDCDLIVTDGDILHYQTFVQFTIVAGKEAYDKEKELFFAHIRPRPEGPPVDAGEEVPEGEEEVVEEEAPEEGSGEDEESEEEPDEEEGEGDDGGEEEGR